MTINPATPTAWPPAEPFFDRDVPIDKRMFDLHHIMYLITVEQVIPRDGGWTVDIVVVGDRTWYVVLSVNTAMLTLFDGRERVAQHVVNGIRDWVERPPAERPNVIEIH